MALALSTRGHICIMISQVRSTVSINPYAKTDPKVTNASGGNALLHYSDWILEFQQRHKADLLTNKVNGKDEIVGHTCKIVFKKLQTKRPTKKSDTLLSMEEKMDKACGLNRKLPTSY